MTEALGSLDKAKPSNEDTHIHSAADATERSGGWSVRLSEWRKKFGRSPFLAGAVVFSLLSSTYWLLVASDRYVSEAAVIVQRTDMGSRAPTDISSLLAGDAGGNRHDQLIMREYLLSRGVAQFLDKELALSEHYSAWTNDPLSRLAFSDTDEEFYNYLKSRVYVEYDEYSGVLVVRAQAFSPQTAQAIARRMIEAGEQFMNQSAQDLAKAQIGYLEGQVAALNAKAIAARQDVVNYQNRVGIASPADEARAIGAIIADLTARKTELQTELTAKRSFLVDTHPSIVELEQQIAALTSQIDKESQRLAAPQGGKLNSKIEEFERLEARAKFSEDVYRAAIASLEKLRFESTRTIKRLSVVQAPNLPQKAELPDRLRQALVYSLLAFLFAGVSHLIVLIIKDHRD